jgi:hypothetical protein
MTDELQAALARAEAAEEARDKFEKLATDLYHARATAERQRDEAIAASDARAEAMREAAAVRARSMGYWNAEAAIRALPIPTQEK